MLDIVALYFLCKMNGSLASKKGLKPLTWKIYTIVAWLVTEAIGLSIGFSMFDKTTIPGFIGACCIGLFCAIGGYLFIRKALENKPDAFDDDINKISVDDLQPPKK